MTRLDVCEGHTAGQRGGVGRWDRAWQETAPIPWRKPQAGSVSWNGGSHGRMTRRDAYSPAWDGKPGGTEGSPHCQASGGGQVLMPPWGHGQAGVWGGRDPPWQVETSASLMRLGMLAAQGSLAAGVALAALHVAGAEAVM